MRWPQTTSKVLSATVRPCPLGTSPPATTRGNLHTGEARPVTIDEELALLDSQLRRLKIEYEIFFSNPTKKPPTDVEWKVLAMLRKFSDGGRLSFSQRFKYNELAQRYAIYSDLWRKKSRIREEGYRRPQDAILSVQGVRSQEHVPEHHVYGISKKNAAAESGPFSVQCSDATAEREKSSNSTAPWSMPRKKAARPSPATSIPSRNSCRKKLPNSASNIAAMQSSTRSNCKTDK